MDTQFHWISRNVSLRLLGLPPMEDRQHAHMENHLSGMATLLDESIKLAEDRLAQGLSRSEALNDASLRRVVAMLAELGWRVPPASNDMAAEQSSLLDDLRLIDSATLASAKEYRVPNAR